MKKVLWLTIALLVLSAAHTLAFDKGYSAIPFGSPFIYTPKVDLGAWNGSGGYFMGDDMDIYQARIQYGLTDSLTIGADAGIAKPDEGDNGTKLGVGASMKLLMMDPFNFYAMANGSLVTHEYFDAYGIGGYGLCTYDWVLPEPVCMRPSFRLDGCRAWAGAGALFQFYDTDWDNETDFDLVFAGGLNIYKGPFYGGIQIGLADKFFTQLDVGIRYPMGVR
jgi:hypothetical protein